MAQNSAPVEENTLSRSHDNFEGTVLQTLSEIKPNTTETQPDDVELQPEKSGHSLALFEDDTAHSSMSHYLRSFKGAEGDDDEDSTPKQHDKLGTMLGVFLPSIQNVLGIQMFLRLLWIVGVAGIVESFTMVAICSLCTFLTSISIAAIATNGLIEGGGPYYMISRNLGAEFGGAIGILYYLANVSASAMYMSGGVELLLMYMAPSLPQFGDPHKYDESAMFNNFRLYATVFLLVEVVICAIGLRFVQIVGPLSLVCVFASILSVYAGAITASPSRSPMICLLGDRVLNTDVYTDVNGTAHCNKTQFGFIWNHFCYWANASTGYICDPYFDSHNASYLPGIPGFSTTVLEENLWPKYMKKGESAPGIKGNPSIEAVQDLSTTFFVLLAILFPAFTDFICGANLSGYLKDPQKSLSIGTVGAQLSTSLIYLSFVLIYGGCVTGPLLRDKYGRGIHDVLVVSKLAWPHEWVLLVGCFTSTFGAALQCLCCAPRLLHAIAKDDILPFLSIFRSVTKRNEPLRALLITALFTEGCILIGGLDYIAPVVNFFYLMCYCFINIVCGLQTLLKAPNWRPRFKFYHWSLSLLGALLCLFIMFATYWYYAIAVLLLCASIYKYIEYKGAKNEWGDGITGLALSTAQYSLLKIENNLKDPKNWRPQVLLLVKMKRGEAHMNRKMMQFSSQLKAGRGLTMVACLVNGDISNPADKEKAWRAKQKVQEMMKQTRVKGFTEVVLGRPENIGAVLQCVGIGALRPNTIVVGWPYNWKEKLNKKYKRYWSFLDTIHRAGTANMCLLVPKGLYMFPEPGDQLAGNIDVWWIIHDGGLMILLPFLLRQHRVWRNCKIRIFTIAHAQDNSEKLKEELQKWVYQLRIEASVSVVEIDDSGIALSTYERTLLMEERARLSLAMTTSTHKLNEVDPQLLYLRNVNSDAVFAGSVARHPTDPAALFFSEGDDAADSGGSIQETDEQQENEASTSEDQRAKSAKRTVDFAKSPTAYANDVVSISDETHSDRDDSKHNMFWLSSSSTSSSSDETDLDEGEKGKDMKRVKSKNFVKQIPFRMRDPLRSKRKMEEKQRRRVSVGYRDEAKDAYEALDKRRLKKMHTAVKLNKEIRARSGSSRLLILNLPRPPHSRESLVYYMEYLEVLTEGLERALLIRGSGKEVVTIHG